MTKNHPQGAMDKITFRKESGFSGIVLLMLIGLGLFFFYATRNIAVSPPSSITADECLPTVDTTKTVTLNGQLYDLIRPNVQIIKGEMGHFTKTTPGQVKDPYGQMSTSYLNTFDHVRDISSSVTWTAEAQNLLWVDANARATDVISGYDFFDVYLKAGSPIPDFIQAFCSSNFPTGIKLLPPGGAPPVTFNTNDLTGNSGMPANTTYYILSYEQVGSPSWNLATGPNSTAAKYTVQISGVTKTYSVYYVPSSNIQYAALVDDDTSSPDHTIAYKYVTSRYVDTSIRNASESAKKNLQLQTFLFPKVPAWGWWSPECKPAIYLYPKEETVVSVQVSPEGFLTYTNPLYPANGWHVTATADGTVVSHGNKYPYLYYESKIRDDVIEKPKAGYIISYENLSAFYQSLMLRLGLNRKETKDFVDYWNGKLPFAPYYFIGVMDMPSIDRIEPLDITPKPDSLLRVRLYFEARTSLVSVTPPELPAVQKRSGFTVVEWGGLVKNDKNHPFTCSQ